MGKQRQRRDRSQQPVKQTFLPSPAFLARVGGINFPPRLGLLLILLTFLVLTTLYSLIVPLTQGEDELAHYRYISFIAETGRLPVNQAERQQAWYRADWPPLYHLLVGWAVSPLDTTQPHLKDVGESPRRRLVGEIFYPRLIIYTEDANWPWQAGILAWHIGRFISICLAAGALVFTYLTVAELCRSAERQLAEQSSPLPLCPPAPLLPLAVTALLAFTPRYLFTSAMLGDDTLFVLLSAIFIWLLLRAIRGDDHWWLYALMGLLLGLSIATKYSTGLLPLVILPVGLWRARQVGWRWPQTWGRIGLSWLFTLVGASWWFGWIGYHFNTVKEEGLFFGLLRPLLAGGPDVSMRRLFAVFSGSEFTGQERPAAIEAGSLWDWLVYLFQTFWGVPVLEHDPLFPWAYLLMLILCLLALAGLWRLWQTTTAEGRFTLAILALIVALLLPFPLLRYFLTHNVLETGQGRHILYPAAQAVPLLLVLGWAMVSRRSRIEDRGSKIEDGGWRIEAGRWKMEDGRSRMEERRERSEERGAKREEEGGSRVDQPSSIFYPLPSIFYPRSSILHPLSSIFYPLSSTLYLLLPGLLLGWSLFLLGYMANTYPAPLPVRTTTFDPTTMPQPLKHNFGQAIQLLGYDFRPDAEQAMINLTLFWRSLAAVEENYRVQVQLVDPAGRPRLTWLSHPLDGRYPTRAWDKGDVIRDTLPLPLAALPAGTYTLQLNLLHEAEDQPLAAEAFQFIQIPLSSTPAIPQAANLAGQIDYRLWLQHTPARHRQTIALSWAERSPAERPVGQTSSASLASLDPAPAVVQWALLGPDEAPRRPVAAGEATAIFIIGPDWPSGDYRLRAEHGASSYQSEPVLTVANDVRLFELPDSLTSTQGSPAAGWIPVEANFADQVKLLGYTLPTRRVQPGGGLPLTLYWQSLAPVLGDYIVFDVLLAENQQPYGGYDRLPREYYSTILWAEGEIVEDGFAVPVAPEAPPGVYHLHVGLYTLATGSPVSLPLVQAGQPAGATSVVIGPLKVGGPPPGVTTDQADPQVALNQTLGNQMTLLGYDRPVVSEQGTGVSLKLRLYWRAETIPAADYTTFVHLRDAANQTVAQQDNPPAGGRYPTSLWDAGEIIVDELSLPLTDVAPGRYPLVIGLYNFATGERLAVPGNPANEVTLEPVEIP